MHAVLTRVDVFSCHVSCCVVGKIRREEHILVRIFYTVRVETHTGREMMVGGWQVIIRWNFHLQFEVAQKPTVVLINTTLLNTVCTFSVPTVLSMIVPAEASFGR